MAAKTLPRVPLWFASCWSMIGSFARGLAVSTHYSGLPRASVFWLTTAQSPEQRLEFV
jgi:hypothetical protein